MAEGATSRLDGISILGGLPGDTRRDFEKRCRWRRFRANEQLLDKDSEDRDVYFVVEGGVQIVNYSLSGREIALARVEAGGYFGELAAIDGRPRSASVVATSDGLLAAASPGLFVNLVIGHPDLAMQLLTRLASIVRSCDERIMDLSTLGAVQRVNIELLRMADEHPDHPDHLLIAKLPAHRQIASRASTTRETVARTISHLLSAGVIARAGDGIAIVDVDELERLASPYETQEAFAR